MIIKGLVIAVLILVAGCQTTKTSTKIEVRANPYHIEDMEVSISYNLHSSS